MEFLNPSTNHESRALVTKFDVSPLSITDTEFRLKDKDFKFGADFLPLEKSKSPWGDKYYVVDKNYDDYLAIKKLSLTNQNQHQLYTDEFSHYEDVFSNYFLERINQDLSEQGKNLAAVKTWQEGILSIQEDVALVKLKDQSNELIFLSICFPNYWAPETKIGKDFSIVHGPVPGMDHVNRASLSLFQRVADRGAVQRYAWGVSTDTRLSHHPNPQLQDYIDLGPGREFESLNSKNYLRVERQVLTPVTNDLLLFMIRTFFIDLNEFLKDEMQKRALLRQVNTMPEDVLNFKGLTVFKQKSLQSLN